MNDYQKIVKLLENEVTPALGCTEPVAIALAAANAVSAVGGQAQEIHLKVSPNIYKNGMAVGIPGIHKTGIDVAASLGATAGDSEKGLEVLENVNKESVYQSLKLVDQHKVHVEIIESKGFFIDCQVKTNQGLGTCVVEDAHTNIVLLKADEKIIKQGERLNRQKDTDDLYLWLKNRSISGLLDLMRTINPNDIDFMLSGRDMNLAVAKIGLKEKFGMGVGYTIQKMIAKGIRSEGWLDYASALTAAASDVRMAGVKMPVMSSAGSGNHGLTAILPVVAVAQKNTVSDLELSRALALSHIITLYVKLYTGKLSPVCGCAVAAGVGASAAIAFMLGSSDKQIEGSIKNMIANVSGMICDGGKAGCALKLSTAASVAVQSAVLAMEDSIVPDDNGIIHPSVEKTIANLGQISESGMKQTDHVILSVMLNNKN